MITNGRIQALLAIACLNDAEYGHRVIWPLLDYLGVPDQARRPQFQIENPFGTGLLKLDYLIHHGSIPLVTIEGEPHARQYDQGFRQAKNYSRNFKPRQRDCDMQERTVPFLITAAGNRAEMCRAVVRGLNVEYEPITQNGRPAFLEWQELLAEALQMPPAAALPPEQPVFIADAATQFFRDLYEKIELVPSLEGKDDQQIILFNSIVQSALLRCENHIQTHCRTAGMGRTSIRQILRTIALYQRAIESPAFTGAAVARGYRTFLLQPGGRGGHHYFTGVSQSRPYIFRGVVRYRNVARFFTPTEIIQQMVRLSRPRAHERVIDMTCGTGGYLAECVDSVSQRDGEIMAQEFLTRRLVGIDDDPFCVSCTRALLTFVYPELADRLLVFLHNSLYQNASRSSEINEDPQAEPYLEPGSYDLVIGNPPGNDEYSGTNRALIKRLWRKRFGHLQGGLMDHHCFVRRAIDLARPDGGRICLLVPEGVLTRDNRGMPSLRQSMLHDCQLRLVITLPRVFKFNNARMAMLYMVRNPRPRRTPSVTVAEVWEKWQDTVGDWRTTDLFGELENLVTRHLNAQAIR